MRFTVIAAAACLAACMSTNTEMLDSRTAIISGAGNAYSNASSIAAMTLREAATQTLAKGFTHFVVINANDATRTSTWSDGGGGTAAASCAGNVCSGAGSWTGPSSTTFVKPGTDLLVRFLTASEAAQVSNAWSAAEVLAANR